MKSEDQGETPEGQGKGIFICKAALHDNGALVLIPNPALPQSETLACTYDAISELAKADAATIRETIERNRQARDN